MTFKEMLTMGLGLSMVLGCGRITKKPASRPSPAAPVPSGSSEDAEAESSENEAGDADTIDNAEDSLKSLQLGDEAVGVKNQDQVIAHFGSATGIRFNELQDFQKNEVRRIAAALPEDNVAGKFSSAHVLATAKLAGFYCGEFVRRERDAQEGRGAMPASPRWPEIDWRTRISNPAFARPLYPYIVDMFWGVDRKGQPERELVYDDMDALVVILSQGQEQRGAELSSLAFGLCVASAVSFVSIEL